MSNVKAHERASARSVPPLVLRFVSLCVPPDPDCTKNKGVCKDRDYKKQHNENSRLTMTVAEDRVKGSGDYLTGERENEEKSGKWVVWVRARDMYQLCSDH